MECGVDALVRSSVYFHNLAMAVFEMLCSNSCLPSAFPSPSRRPLKLVGLFFGLSLFVFIALQCTQVDDIKYQVRK